MPPFARSAFTMEGALVDPVHGRLGGRTLPSDGNAAHAAPRRRQVARAPPEPPGISTRPCSRPTENLPSGSARVHMAVVVNPTRRRVLAVGVFALPALAAP